MIGQRFHRHSGVSTMHRYGQLNGVGFWDAFESLAEFGADAGAADFADFAFDAPTFDVSDMAFDAGDFAYEPDFAVDAFSADDLTPYTPLEYDAQYQFADVIDNGSGNVDAGLDFESYVRESGGQMVNDAPVRALDDTDMGMDYGGVPGEVTIPDDHWSYNAVTGSGSGVSFPSSIPSWPGSGSPTGNSNTTTSTNEIVRTITDTGPSVLKTVLDMTPKVLDIYGSVLKNEKQNELLQTQLELLRQSNPFNPLNPNDPRNRLPLTLPPLNPLGDPFTRITQSIKDNPVPWALGAGAALLLLLSGKSKSAPSARRRSATRVVHFRRKRKG